MKREGAECVKNRLSGSYAVVVVVAVQSLAVPAFADVIYSNLGSGDSFGSGVWHVAGAAGFADSVAAPEAFQFADVNLLLSTFGSGGSFCPKTRAGSPISANCSTVR